MIRRVALLTLLSVFCWPLAAFAAPIPPAIEKQLQQEISSSERGLDKARKKLTAAVTEHKKKQSQLVLFKTDLSVVEEMGTLIPGFQNLDYARELKQRSKAVELREQEALKRLEQQTIRAADAQGEALDSARRLNALKRASATESVLSTTHGSYLFGGSNKRVNATLIDEYLASKASPMTGSGEHFVAAGIEYDLDPRLLVAIAGAESYFGLQLCANHNAWGWGCPTSPFAFESWRHGIQAVAKGLRENYLDGGRTSVGEIHLKYAPPNADNDPTGLNYAWPNNVARFIVEMGGDPDNVAGRQKEQR